MERSYAVCMVLLVLVQLVLCQHCILNDESEPQHVEDMPSCCWYSSLTCCTTDSFLDGVASIMDQMASRVAHKSQKDIDCLAYLEDFYCVLCSTGAADYSTRLSGGSTIKVEVCSDWCGSFYHACSGLYWIGTWDDPNDACHYLDDVLSNVSVKIMTSSIDHPGMCFEGAGKHTIEDSPCFTYEVDDSDVGDESSGSPQSPQSPASPQSPGSPASPGEESPAGDEEQQGRFDGLWWFLGTSGGAALLFIFVAIAIGAMVLLQRWRRRKGVNWITKEDESSMAVEMDELGEEEDITDDLSAFVDE